MAHTDQEVGTFQFKAVKTGCGSVCAIQMRMLKNACQFCRTCIESAGVLSPIPFTFGTSLTAFLMLLIPHLWQGELFGVFLSLLLILEYIILHFYKAKLGCCKMAVREEKKLIEVERDL